MDYYIQLLYNVNYAIFASYYYEFISSNLGLHYKFFISNTFCLNQEFFILHSKMEYYWVFSFEKT